MEKNLKNIPDFILTKLNVIITDKDNIITFVSEKYASVMGYTVDELIGNNPSILKYPDKHKFLPWGVILWDELNSKHHWSGILKNITKGGDVVYFNADMYKNFDEDGNHIGYHSIHTDASKSILNPHQFLFDNELSQIFFSDNVDLVAICLCESENNPKQKILEISKKFTDIIGISRDYIIKNEISFTEIISKKSKYYMNLDLMVDDYKKGIDIIIHLDNTNSHTMKYKLGVTPFHFHGNLARIFKLTDITKELEYSEQLNEIIKSKNNFLANVSHEIKTPMNAINGFLTLLQMREKNKESLDYINIVLENVRHISDLTNDVIDFTGMDNNKLEIVPREFTSKDVQTTIELFFARSLDKNIEFTTYISPQLPEVMEQDILRLKQIITNLISNSLKFVSEGGTIIIDVNYHLGKLYFNVDDNGIGMTEDQIKKIFNPFSQASKDTKMFYGGTGLGLSVVKKIIEAMDGSINVESKPNKGSTFSVIVPVKPIIESKLEGKLKLDDISIFAPSFSNKKYAIVEKYLMNFTTANIHKTNNLKKLTDNDIIIVNLNDIIDINVVLKLGEKNKVVLIKKMSDVLQPFENSENIAEINLPIIGSKLYDALHILMDNIKPLKEKDRSLDLQISGNILVADDLDSNRTLIKELLTPYDIEISFAKNGQEALNIFHSNIKNKKSKFDLILLDMNMPVVTGYEAAKKIRDFEDTLDIIHTPIAALTANRYNNKDDSRLVNMDEYLPKPINLKHLLTIIIKHTSNLENTHHINFDNFDKIKVMKDIKDNFLNKKQIKILIHKSKEQFTDTEFEILTEISKMKNDKRLFNTLYNKVMKLVRKNN